MRYHLCPTRYCYGNHTFIGNLCHYEHTYLFIAWPDALLYILQHILNGASDYLYHFQRVTTRYLQIFKKQVYYYLFYKTDDKA